MSISELSMKYQVLQSKQEREYPKRKFDSNLKLKESEVKYQNNIPNLTPIPDCVEIRIQFNDVYFFKYIIAGIDKVSKEKVNEMIKKVSSELKISGNTEEYEFYCEKEIIKDLTLNDYVYKVFSTKQTLNIYYNNKYNLSKEDNIILKQKMNGLWKIDSYMLSLFKLNFEQWKLFIDRNKRTIEKALLFENDIDEEIVFSIIVLCHIRNEFNGKKRANLIIKKSIKGLNGRFKEIFEERIKKIPKRSKKKAEIKAKNIKKKSPLSQNNPFTVKKYFPNKEQKAQRLRFKIEKELKFISSGNGESTPFYAKKIKANNSIKESFSSIDLIDDHNKKELTSLEKSGAQKRSEFEEIGDSQRISKEIKKNKKKNKKSGKLLDKKRKKEIVYPK